MNPNATVVSLMPARICEEKPGLYPGVFIIPPVKDPNDFNILHVGVSHYFVYMDSTRGSLRVPELGSRIARAIVEDYIGAQIAIRDGHAPGIFYVEGLVEKPDIPIKYAEQLEEARANQKRWFQSLIMVGDDTWKKFGIHQSIAEIQRVAAKALKHEADWVV